MIFLPNIRPKAMALCQHSIPYILVIDCEIKLKFVNYGYLYVLFQTTEPKFKYSKTIILGYYSSVLYRKFANLADLKFRKGTDEYNVFQSYNSKERKL